MRKLFFALVLVLSIILVITSLPELGDIAETLERSNWWFLAAAFFVECLWLFNMATTYGLLYRLVGLQENRMRLLLIATAANFVNVVAPSAGIGGMAVFLDDARRRNHSPGRVTVIGALFVLFDFVAFLCVLALGWVVLIRRNSLDAGEITASLILLALALVFGGIIYLGYKSAAALGEALAKGARSINRILRPFLRREYLSEQRAREFACEMGEGLAAIRGKGRDLLWPFLFALNNKALLICVLAFVFLALGTPFTAGTLVGGFSIGHLFLIVSPTPAGMGIVEGILPVALNSLRVRWGAAVFITLTYRAVTFWFPLAVGAAAFRLVQRQPHQMVASSK